MKRDRGGHKRAMQQWLAHQKASALQFGKAAPLNPVLLHCRNSFTEPDMKSVSADEMFDPAHAR